MEAFTSLWGEVMSWDDGISTGGQPYMWANGVFLILLRNMLLHEAGEWLAERPSGPKELWICPATPRKWMHEPIGSSLSTLLPTSVR